MTTSPGDKVDASPTKEFFISMLIKDIDLLHAILDLLDNSVDGARRLRTKGDFSGLWVHVEAHADRFSVADNCGGIPLSVARDYAFRFGRPEQVAPTDHSVGHVGVGMKRAFFKLGGRFRVESASPEGSFVVDEDVGRWKRRPTEWTFELKPGAANPGGEYGTTIVVTSLHETVAETFSQEYFSARLGSELAMAHLESTRRGLTITVNGVPVQKRQPSLLQSGDLHPVFIERTIPTPSDDVHVRLYAGVGTSEPTEAGWYVFCNGRLVLDHDQSARTGWGEWGDEHERRLPKYHNQYARFRGYVFFESRNAATLPWNTTKKDVDTDSPLYRAVMLDMVSAARPIVVFLNRLRRDKELALADDETSELEEVVEQAESVPLDRVKHHKVFVAPVASRVAHEPPTKVIQYMKPVREIEKVKKQLNVDTLKEVGERTFDYYRRMECE